MLLICFQETESFAEEIKSLTSKLLMKEGKLVSADEVQLYSVNFTKYKIRHIIIRAVELTR